MDSPMAPKEIQGIQAVLDKSKAWKDNTETHAIEISEPLVAGHQFAVRFAYDVTCKQTNQRMNMEEIGLYTDADGKIVREQFIYDACMAE